MSRRRVLKVMLMESCAVAIQIVCIGLMESMMTFFNTVIRSARRWSDNDWRWSDQLKWTAEVDKSNKWNTFSELLKELKVKNRVRSLAANIHLMYEWGKGWHIPAAWALDGKEICYYDSQLSGNNSSPPFAYYTIIPLWSLDQCSWVPTRYRNGGVDVKGGGEYLPKDANKHLPSPKFLSSSPLTVFWNSSPTHSNRQVS